MYVKSICTYKVKHKFKKVFNKTKGILYATPLLVALVIIEMADILFAIDSICSVGYLLHYFIVITSNIFAIIGLRSLYLLLAGIMEKSIISNLD